MRAMRWGDNDRYFGPFTFAPGKPYPHWAVMLESAGDRDSSNDDKCYLRISTPWFTFASVLPHIVRPHREKRYPDWDAETVKRLGRNFYWEIDQRTYGISYSDGFLQVKYGRNGGSMMDSRIEQSWCKHLPWTQWRQVSHVLYGSDGRASENIASLPWERYSPIKDAVSRVGFTIEDFDNEQIAVKTYIEERVWSLGTGWFKWLGYFAPNKRRRSLDMSFANEVGPEKGSWKGGMVGTSIEMLAGETHERAFRRFCEEDHRSKSRKFRMKFLGVADTRRTEGAGFTPRDGFSEQAPS